MVNNWSAGVDPDYFTGKTSEGLTGVATLNNGRTYGIIGKSSTKTFVELTPNGLRDTGAVLTNSKSSPRTTSSMLHADGSLRNVVANGSTATYKTQTLSGFDANYNPLWNAAADMASVGYTPDFDPVSAYSRSPNGTAVPVSSSNVLVTFNPSNEPGWHLGGINPTTNQWLWKASPTGQLDGLGTYDLGSNYGGNIHHLNGRNIIYGYHGEGWRGGQANQWMHFYDNGLFIGQYGQASGTGSDPNAPGLAGNAFCWSFIQAPNGNYYTYNGGEAAAGGIHRWRIDGLSTITEQSVNITLTAKGNGIGLTGQYYNDQNLTNLVFTRTDPKVQFTWSGTNSPDPAIPGDFFSIRWQGQVQPLYTQTYTFYTQSDDGVRLWVNGTQLINDWTIHSSKENVGIPITLTAGQKYDIVLEYYDYNNGATAQLKWSSSSQAKEIIPFTQLYPMKSYGIDSGKNGGKGLSAEYFKTANLTSSGLKRVDPTVNFTWTGSPDSSNNTIPVDNFSVRWKGAIQPFFSESYTFYTQSDAGVRLWIDGNLVIDNWAAHISTENSSAAIPLIAGRKYDIVMEHWEDTGTAVAQLKWSSTSQVKTVVPATQLYEEMVDTPGGFMGTSASGFVYDLYCIGGKNVGTQTTLYGVDLSARNSAAQRIYESQREVTSASSSIAYSIPGFTPNAPCVVRLHFNETALADPTKRRGNVSINGSAVLTNYSVYSDSAALYKAVVKQFPATVDANGRINISLTGNTFRISGVEILH